MFKQTLRDIILLCQDLEELDMNLEEWKQLCRKAWENDYAYLQKETYLLKFEKVDTLLEIIVN